MKPLLKVVSLFCFAFFVQIFAIKRTPRVYPCSTLKHYEVKKTKITSSSQKNTSADPLVFSQQSFISLEKNNQKPFVILIATYNNEPYCAENLLSALNQAYDNYRIIIINDASTDRTLEIIKNIIYQNDHSHRVTIVNNEVRQGAMYNHYYTIHNLILPCEIIVILDGDDRLHDNQVLAYLNTVYANSSREIWLTYGQFWNIHSRTVGFCRPMPAHIVNNNAFREWTHGPSHLRTFYAWLFQLIRKEDLMWKGRFFEMTCDLAAMFPMIEMARDHFMFIDRILLDYNDNNPLSDHRQNYGLQVEIDQHLRKKPRYTPLSHAPFPLH